MSDTSPQTQANTAVKKSKTKKVKAPDNGKLDQFGFRQGSLKSRAAAMYVAKKGATLGEVKSALKSTQFNVLTELEGKGYKVERMPVSGANDRKVTKYHVVTR